MPFLICDLCKVRKNRAGKGFIEGSIVQCLMVSAISHIPILCKSELNLLCEALFRICFCFRGCGSVHILFFRRIVSKRLFSIPNASRGRVAPANPRAAYMRPLHARRRGRGCCAESARSGQDRSLHGTRERRIVGRCGVVSVGPRLSVAKPGSEQCLPLRGKQPHERASFAGWRRSLCAAKRS